MIFLLLVLQVLPLLYVLLLVGGTLAAVDSSSARTIVLRYTWLLLLNVLPFVMICVIESHPFNYYEGRGLGFTRVGGGRDEPWQVAVVDRIHACHDLLLAFLAGWGVFLWLGYRWLMVTLLALAWVFGRLAAHWNWYL